MKNLIKIFSVLLVIILMSFSLGKKSLNIKEIRIKTGDNIYNSYAVNDNILLNNSPINLLAGAWDKSNGSFRMMIITENENDYNFCYKLIPYEIISGKVKTSKQIESEGVFLNISSMGSKKVDREGYYELSPKMTKNARYFLEVYNCKKKSLGKLEIKFYIDQ